MPSELEILTRSIVNQEPEADVMRVACAVTLAKAHFITVGVHELIDLLDKSAALYVESMRLPPDRVGAAIQALQRASETYQYLQSLPE